MGKEVHRVKVGPGPVIEDNLRAEVLGRLGDGAGTSAWERWRTKRRDVLGTKQTNREFQNAPDHLSAHPCLFPSFPRTHSVGLPLLNSSDCSQTLAKQSCNRS
jgi:hypothetical protein